MESSHPAAAFPMGGRQEHSKQTNPAPHGPNTWWRISFSSMLYGGVTAACTTSKQSIDIKTSLFQTKHMRKKKKHKQSLCNISISISCSLSFPRACDSGESVFQPLALSADPGSVSQQSLPHHERLQRGGGGWANVSQGLLRSPSTEKYARRAGMEVKTKGCGKWNRWVKAKQQDRKNREVKEGYKFG